MKPRKSTLRFDREHVRALSPVEEIVGDDLELRRRGRSLVGLCPFHTEKTPSFTLSPERQTFHCFGCGEHGDVFRYLMLRDGVTFGQALRVLARRVGLDPEPATCTDSRSPATTSRPWPPSPAERRRSDRSLGQAYAEVESQQAESLQKRWEEADRRLRRTGVDPDRVTLEDWSDISKMGALADYYAALNVIDQDEQFFEALSQQRHAEEMTRDEQRRTVRNPRSVSRRVSTLQGIPTLGRETERRRPSGVRVPR